MASAVAGERDELRVAFIVQDEPLVGHWEGELNSEPGGMVESLLRCLFAAKLPPIAEQSEAADQPGAPGLPTSFVGCLGAA